MSKRKRYVRPVRPVPNVAMSVGAAPAAPVIQSDQGVGAPSGSPSPVPAIPLYTSHVTMTPPMVMQQPGPPGPPGPPHLVPMAQPASMAPMAPMALRAPLHPCGPCGPCGPIGARPMDGRPAAWQSDLAHGLQGLQGLQGPSQACPVPCQVPCQITPRPWGDPFLGDQLPAARKVTAAPASLSLRRQKFVVQIHSEII